MSMLRKYIHSEFNNVYEELGDGTVRVTEPSGKTGVFEISGRWIEGDFRDASLQMLIFTGGPMIPAEFNYRSNPVMYADTNRPSGWPEPCERILKQRGIL